MKSNDLPSYQRLELGMTVEHGGFSGTIVGINHRDLVIDVRITAVSRHAPRNRIGRVIEVPFDGILLPP